MILNFSNLPTTSDRRLIHIKFLARFGHVIANLTNISTVEAWPADSITATTTATITMISENFTFESQNQNSTGSLPIIITHQQESRSSPLLKELVFGDVELVPIETSNNTIKNQNNNNILHHQSSSSKNYYSYYSFVAAKECFNKALEDGPLFCSLMIPERNVITGVLRLDREVMLIPGQCSNITDVTTIMANCSKKNFSDGL